MEIVANQPANQNLDHVPFGADPAMRQAVMGGKIYRGAAVSYASRSVKNPYLPPIKNRISQKYQISIGAAHD